MSAPIFRDPVWDGAADPAVIRREGTGEWWMFYTQRRATLGGEGVRWVHGSRIGVAVSTDAGGSWQYRGTVAGLDEAHQRDLLDTHWAPEVVRLDGRYHLYLSVVPGEPATWSGHPRRIVHFESDDLEHWRRVGEVPLSSDRVIDAAVARTGDGRLRLWYKDEAQESTTWVAVSDDGYDWTVEGQAVGGPPHEGPNVFVLGGWWWMIVDEWRGQAVYRSPDGLRWERQESGDGLILAEPGSHPEDRQVGRHADVVVQGDTAYVFYFTHPLWAGSEVTDAEADDSRRSAVHVARLMLQTGEGSFGPVLAAERDTAIGAGFLSQSV